MVHPRRSSPRLDALDVHSEWCHIPARRSVLRLPQITMKLALAAIAGINAMIWLLIFVLDHQLP